MHSAPSWCLVYIDADAGMHWWRLRISDCCRNKDDRAVDKWTWTGR